MTKIDVISSCLVGMAGDGGAPSMSELQLCAFDLHLILLDPIQRGILFEKPPHESSQTLIHRLKTSLSRTLDFFPPIAGRLATTAANDGLTTYFVNCNNAGVEFIHAAAAAVTVSDIIEQKYVPKIVSSLFPHIGFRNCEGVSKPLLAVQVTELADGVFIGCTANHCVVDGVSFWHFFNSWSEISRGSNTISKYPIFKCSYPAVALPPLNTSLPEKLAPPPLLERIFHFSEESVAKLKAKANEEAGTDKISSLQALSAHLWRCSLRCRRNLGGGEAGFKMTASARPRMPLPEGYFGNTAYGAGFAVDEAEVLEKGLGHAALKINEFVATLTKETVEKFVEEWNENPKLDESWSDVFFIISSPRHNVYGNDFGWGKPIAIRSGEAQKFDGRVSALPAAVAGGVHAEVCLAPEVLQAMEADAEFLESLAI